MDLRTSQIFWPLKNGLKKSFPSLASSIKADVVIMGAGISGALVAHRLCEEGLDVVVVDKRDCGFGSTAASTALLQYEIDKPLHELIPLVGVDHAVRSYKLCLDAIKELKKISGRTFEKSDFELKPSFQYASYKSHIKDLRNELELRREHKISSIEWLSSSEIKKKYGFVKEGGILSEDGAQVDPFKLTQNLLHLHEGKNLRIFDNTKITEIKHKRTGVELMTSDGHFIKAGSLVIACGYESENYLPKKVEIKHCSYAIVSEVMDQKNFWYKNSLIWETKTPYLYVRTTGDNRILVGGMDDDFNSPDKRDLSLDRKAKSLEKNFKSLFPEMNFKIDYQWGGAFCETKDGLPYIGSVKERPHTYFALGFGGNGITFSMVAADIIRDTILKRKNDNLSLFSFNR